MEKRLIKIATELNVGLHTIVEYLNGKGFEIEDKPTAKVTDEMYNELLKEFQKSVVIKEQAAQLVIGTRPSGSPAKKEGSGKADGSSDQQVEAPVADEPKEERVAPRLKVLGKIDLGSSLKSRLRSGSAPEEPPAPPPPAPPAPVEETKPVVETPAPTPVEPPVEEVAQQPAPQPRQEEKVSPPPAQPEPQPAAPPEAEAQPVPPIAAEAAPPTDTTPPAEAAPPAPPSTPAPGAETPEPGSGLMRAEAPELRGLKIMGKIDLQAQGGRSGRGSAKKEKPKAPGAAPAANAGGPNRPPANAGAATGEGSDADKNKRKRKRKKVAASTDNNNNNTASRTGANNNTRGPSSAPGARPTGNARSGNDNNSQEVSQREIEEKIKATMARLSGGGKKKRQKMRRDNRERLRERQELREAETHTDKLQVTEFISVQELANMMDVPAVEVIMTCMNLGVIVSINQRLDAEIIELVASEFNHEVEFISVEEQAEDDLDVEDDPEDLLPRAPIVTVMGHVDHGKTSLLDYIRNANVAGGEAGGITQHVGAYEVEVGEAKKKITFLDTPGHEAFTAMRARGAKVTDIAVIIIAADDSIMPQTREAISHAQAANVPMVFAINKVDKDGANPEKIKQELASMNLLVEEWGGKYQSQDISAKTGLGIDSLLERILLEAEMLDLKANPDRGAIGTVVEASLDKGRGYVTKMLVQTGTLHIGDTLVAGEYAGRVKAMFNERNKRIKEAGPSAPVLVLGLGGAPQAGERFKVVENEQEARQIAGKRAQIAREQANRATKRISLDEIGRRLALGNFKELNLIVKGDVDGSIEALSDSLIKLSQETVAVRVIHKAVGAITETDVLLASASDAIIVGFQVRPSANARKLAEREGVEIKMYSIIYEAIDEIKMAIEGLLEPTKEESIVAQVQVREVFKVSKVGTVAGCLVDEGRITRSTNVRVVRDGIVVFPTKEGAVGEIDSLKRFKDDVKEVKAGFECGITIKNFNDIRIGDVIEGFEIKEIKQKLA